MCYFILAHHYHVHREMKFKCEKCNKLFPFKSPLDKHMGKCDGILKEKRQEKQVLKNIEYKIIADENSQKILQCMRCDKKFNTVHGFYQHFRQVHREKNFQCAQCTSLFSSKYFLKQHLNVCDEIEKEFRKMKPKETLKGIEYKIIRDENSSNSYQCKKCEKNFSNVGLVHQHIYQVHKEKKHKCKNCERLFPFNRGFV